MTDWKRKLAVYLHDPPSKCLDIRTHGERSDAAFRQAGFVDTEVGEYFAHADHTAAAADRLPFPRSQNAGLSCVFDGIRNSFRHPLSGQTLPFQREFASVEQGFEGESSVQPALSGESLASLTDDAMRWRARFFAHWRLWPKHAVEKDCRLALLPADTRIPDHSIWTHMQVVSALDGCADDKKLKPAFLKFQLGPVQDFIAAARSIRDLWSGSYLLSWLMAAGLKALSAEVGPDAVIFPNLRGQPLFDLHWREELWSRASINDRETIWDSLNPPERDLLTPNLPNVFLAVVPAKHAAELAQTVAGAIQAEWEKIADAVWRECEGAGLTADEHDCTTAQRKQRFNTQVERFLSLSWHATPWPDSVEAALKLAEGFAADTPVAQARDRVQRVVDMAEKEMPDKDRDRRFYTDDTRTKLNNIGLGWSVILARNSWELDAVRQTRAFDAANEGGWKVGTFSNKDALTGREEAVAGGREWARRAEDAEGYSPALFMMNTGVTRMGNPSVGAWVTYGLGSASDDLPAFLVMSDPKDRGLPKGHASNWTAGFLPGVYQGTWLKPKGEPIDNLKRPADLTESRQREQLDLLAKLNRGGLSQSSADGELAARIDSFELAYRMQTAAPEAFDITREPEHIRKLYGLDQPHCAHISAQCLTARRLVERGTRFVQIYSGGMDNQLSWDCHLDLIGNHTGFARETDQPFAGLLADLAQRGLLKDTLVICGGEFGRLPVSQKGEKPGRDHNPHAFTIWMAGGGVKGGTHYGESDDIGHKAAVDKVSVRDFHATLLHALGLDHEKLIFPFQGLDQRLTGVEKARVVKEIFA